MFDRAEFEKYCADELEAPNTYSAGLIRIEKEYDVSLDVEYAKDKCKNIELILDSNIDKDVEKKKNLDLRSYLRKFIKYKDGHKNEISFETAILIVKQELQKQGIIINQDDYDGLIIKQLVASNTLDDGRKTNQTHIAITGQQMDIFPYLCADGYFYEGGKIADVDLKKYFVLRIPVAIYKDNCEYLGNSGSICFTDNTIEASTCVVRSKRENQADQLQVSMLNMDDPNFVEFRKLLVNGTYFVLLKCRSKMKYHAFGIKNDEKTTNIFSNLNNHFYKLSTNTIVSTDSFNNSNEKSSDSKTGLPTRQKRLQKKFALNNILYGAPGTGKTYSTARYALAIIENKDLSDIKPEEDVMPRYNSLVSAGQIVFTTFHQNYGYEDFIQGIRPDISATGGMAFKIVDGVFKSIADKAMNDPNNDYVIIIDEINRANISKVFGELITLIEDDKRWGEENAISATLQSGEIFAVPNNLYIVGTMNSADKSISLIDTALRRRFIFIECIPNLDLVKNLQLRSVLKKLNMGIAKELNSTDLLIGHSYFMKKQENDLCNIMNQSIIPLLYEYFFDNQKKVKAQLETATEGMDVEVKESSLGRITLVKKESK